MMSCSKIVKIEVILSITIMEALEWAFRLYVGTFYDLSNVLRTWNSSIKSK